MLRAVVAAGSLLPWGCCRWPAWPLAGGGAPALVEGLRPVGDDGRGACARRKGVVAGSLVWAWWCAAVLERERLIRLRLG